MLLTTEGKNKEEDDKLYAFGFIVVFVIIIGVITVVVGVGYANSKPAKVVKIPTIAPSKSVSNSFQAPALIITEPKKSLTSIPVEATQQPTQTPIPTQNPTNTPIPPPTTAPTSSPTIEPTVTPTPSHTPTSNISP